MTSEIRLIQEIEKYEYLYNNSLPEYNRKEPSDAAWAKISQSTDLTVTECKEKWRNIRCSLLRSLKPSDKVKKPYYLSPYLHFVVPFMKTINQTDYQEELQNVTINNQKESDFVLCTIKTEEEEAANTIDPMNNAILNSEPQFVPLPDPVQPKRAFKRKRNFATNRKLKRIKQKKPEADEETYTVIDTPKSNNESMKYFLMSLLPELETMTEDQSRVFKIKVMMMIDDIKTNFSETKQNFISSSESDRLQKRLINLLLRNLKK